MLELPGMNNTGDVRKDLDAIRRYLTKVVPQIDMELMRAQQDDYTDAMNALTQEIGTVDKNSTAGALASHELRKDNPHGVTLEQLGFSMGNFVRVKYTSESLVVMIGDKKGLKIVTQDAVRTVREWTQVGGVSFAEVAVGDWEEKIPLLFYTGVSLRGGVPSDYWAGPLRGTTNETIGTLRIYHECSIETGEDADNDKTIIDESRNVSMTIIGVGVFGYGE